jgi:ABC-type branched-subunit amino acid transport system ATPase component/ABC-type branched-subunit amino acid transport system permease subunit
MKLRSLTSRKLERKKRTIQLTAILVAGLVLMILMGSSGLVGSYVSYLINLTLIYAIGTLSISMLASYSGIWSIGHTAFLAIGAYLSANLSTRGFTVETIVVIGFLISLVIGIVVGLSAGRFSTLYMAILTLAIGLVANEIIGRWHSVTGGDQGISVASACLLFRKNPLSGDENVLLTIVLVTLTFLLVTIITRGNLGRRWLAVKSQRVASMSIGLKPSIENALAFGISGAITSTAGVAMAFSTMYISPESFSLVVATNLLLCTVVGGVGSIGGSLLGAMFLVIVPEMAREVQGISAYVFGAATILVLLFLPKGIVPGIINLLRQLSNRRDMTTAFSEVSADDSMKNEFGEHLASYVAELLNPAESSLNISGLSVSFGGVRALDDISLEVNPGSVVGLIGPNGAGKTTLLNVLSGYVKPTSVQAMRLGNIDFTRIGPSNRIKYGFGRTFQHAELFNELTIEENVILAARQRHRIQKRQHTGEDSMLVAERLVDSLRLRPYANLYPAEVPFGVQKVTDIARALATGAQIIVMDEPFSGLDSDERTEVRTILQGMKKAGVSILIIDHVVQEVLDIADQMVVLDFGSIIATGSPEKIRNDPKVLEAYLGSALKEGKQVLSK